MPPGATFALWCATQCDGARRFRDRPMRCPPLRSMPRARSGMIPRFPLPRCRAMRGASIGADAMEAAATDGPRWRCDECDGGGCAPADPEQRRLGAQSCGLCAFGVQPPPANPCISAVGLHLTSSAKACAKYISADQAQIAFLASGGPQRDKVQPRSRWRRVRLWLGSDAVPGRAPVSSTLPSPNFGESGAAVRAPNWS